MFPRHIRHDHGSIGLPPSRVFCIKGAQNAPFAALLLQCTADFVCSRRFCRSGSHSRPACFRHALQPDSSAAAAAGHECLYACASCLCLSVCLANPIIVTATSHHGLQDRFSSSVSGISRRDTLCLSVSTFTALSARDRQSFFRFPQPQRRLGRISAATRLQLSSQLLCSCRFVTIIFCISYLPFAWLFAVRLSSDCVSVSLRCHLPPTMCTRTCSSPYKHCASE